MTYLPTLALMFFALIVWRKGWYRTGLALILVGAVVALTAQTWFQDILKAYAEGPLANQRMSAFKRLDALEAQVAAQAQQLADQQAALKTQAAGLNAQRDALTDQQQTWEALQGELTVTQQRIEDQRKQLGTIGTLAQDIAGGENTEELQPGASHRVILVPRAKGAFLYFQLWQVPRPDTVALTWRGEPLPTHLFQVHRNVVLVKSDEKLRNLERHPFAVSYIPDTSLADTHATLTQRDDAVYADGESLADVFQDLLTSEP